MTEAMTSPGADPNGKGSLLFSGGRAATRGVRAQTRRTSRALRTLLVYCATFLALLVLNFALPRLLPGDPIQAMQDRGSASFVSSAKERAKLRAYYGLDRSLPGQFGHYGANLLTADLGTSIRYQTPVLEVIGERLPWTLLLLGTGFLLSGLVGLVAGIHSGWRRGRASDRTLLALLVGVRNFPPFFVGSLLLLVFSVELGWFPLAGASTRFADLGPLQRIGDVLWHLALPSTTVALSVMGTQYLLMRNSMVGELGDPYLLLGRAKGLSERRLKYRYAARNALLPVLTLSAFQVGVAMNLVIFVEAVFAYPGLGRLIFDAAAARDYPVLSGAALVLTLMVLAVSMLLDFLYPRLDPRTREAR